MDVAPEVLPIVFTNEYKSALTTVNKFVVEENYCEEALKASLDALRICKGNYAIWAFRRRCLTHMYDLEKEGLSDAARSALLDEISVNAELMQDSLKSYQLWQHRLWIIGILRDFSTEDAFLRNILAQDAKNYHAWQHRLSLARIFNWSAEAEMSFARELIEQDHRNNSAWSYLCAFRLGVSASADSVIDLVEYAAEWLMRGPNNEAAVNVVYAALNELSQRSAADTSFLEGGLTLQLFPKLLRAFEKYGTPSCCPVSPFLLSLLLRLDCLGIDRSCVTTLPPEDIASHGIQLE